MKKVLTRLISAIVLISFLCVGTMFPARQAQAVGFWGDAIPAAILKQKLEEIYDYVKFTVVATMQNAAMKVLYTYMQQVIGKTGIVTNFYENLYVYSSQQAVLFTEDLITTTLRGQGTGTFTAWTSSNSTSQSSNWSINNSTTGTSTTVGGGSSCSWKDPDSGETVDSCASYASILETAAKNAIKDSGLGAYDVQEYCSDTTNTFNSQNSGHGWSCFLSQLEWNPVKISLEADAAKEHLQQQITKVNETQAVAYQGFNPKLVSGQVVVPGSTLKEMMSNVLDIPNKIIAAVEHPGQISVILSGFMQQLMNEVTNYGFTLVRQQIDNQMNKLNESISRALNQSISKNGPQSTYGKNY